MYSIKLDALYAFHILTYYLSKSIKDQLVFICGCDQLLLSISDKLYLFVYLLRLQIIKIYFRRTYHNLNGDERFILAFGVII